MQRNIFLCLLVALTFSPLAAQNPDSLALLRGPWQQEDIAPGIAWRQVHFQNKELFGSNQCLQLLVIAPGAGVFGIATEPLLTTTGEVAEKNEALAAINGSFFTFNYEYNTDDYNSVDYIRVNNKRLADNTYSATGQRQMHQRSALAILNGELFIVKASPEKGWEKYIYSQDVLTSGPLLGIDGRLETQREDSFALTRHPRTAVGRCADGTVLLLTVDGRRPEVEGMQLKELQNVLRWLGATDLINLDGGGSTTMYIKDKGVVNYPSDNKLFDHEGSRKVANAVIVGMKSEK